MFENFDFNLITERALARVSDNIDKREGSIIYDALAPTTTELVNMYIALDMVINEGFADTASYYYLAKRAAERGIYPYGATKAVLKMEIAPITVELSVGERFNLDTLNYAVIEKISNGIYKIECETVGTEGNGRFGTAIPINYIEGLATATITELITPGEDMEDEESFRNRYFSSLNSQSYGGNVADYVNKVNAIAGVGGVKVVRAWDGGGTVKLIIIDSTYSKPSTEFIADIQKEIDPEPGQGYGIAPIGHVVTVTGVEKSTIDISSVITYQDGYSFIDIKTQIESVIDEYFLELARTWADNDNIIVRISQIETRLLNIAGVIDITDTLLNQQAQNITLDMDHIPIRGDVVG